MRTCGTESAYRAGCRCDDCRAARATARKRWKKYSPSSSGTHGTYATYRAKGCRCDDCRNAYAARRKEWASCARPQHMTFKGDDVTGYRHDSHDPFSRLYVTPPPADPECTGRSDLFVDWLSTPGVMRGGHPTEWAQLYVREALRICARCPVQQWCVDVATVPHRSGVTIIAGGKLWVKGRVVWDVARQEAWEAAQDYEAAS